MLTVTRIILAKAEVSLADESQYCTYKGWVNGETWRTPAAAVADMWAGAGEVDGVVGRFKSMDGGDTTRSLYSTAFHWGFGVSRKGRMGYKLLRWEFYSYISKVIM